MRINFHVLSEKITTLNIWSMVKKPAKYYLPRTMKTDQKLSDIATWMKFQNESQGKNIKTCILAFVLALLHKMQQISWGFYFQKKDAQCKQIPDLCRKFHELFVQTSEWSKSQEPAVSLGWPSILKCWAETFQFRTEKVTVCSCG